MGQEGPPTSPLGLYLDVDFQIENISYLLDEPWATEHAKKQLTQTDIIQAVNRYNNVVLEIHITLKVIKAAV
jgi:hypothetical protein